MKLFSFSKSERLLRRQDFVKLSEAGKKVYSDYFVILYSQNGLGRLRLGVTVSKKVGHAVVRSRIKRLVREFFRLHKALFSGSYDVNVIAKRGASELSAYQTRDALERIVRSILKVCKHEAFPAGTH